MLEYMSQMCFSQRTVAFKTDHAKGARTQAAGPLICLSTGVSESRQVTFQLGRSSHSEVCSGDGCSLMTCAPRGSHCLLDPDYWQLSLFFLRQPRPGPYLTPTSAKCCTCQTEFPTLRVDLPEALSQGLGGRGLACDPTRGRSI